MNQKYPQNVVWYLEAFSQHNAASSPQCGSAVAIWLKHKDESGSGRRYLLTAAHVVRGPAADGPDGVGPLLDHILAWEPGRGYTQLSAREKPVPGRGVSGSHFAKPVDGFGVRAEDLPPDDRAAAADWILLEVENAEFSTSGDCVYGWGDAGSSNISVVGYPGCASQWRTGDLVVAHDSRNFRIIREKDGVLHLTGPEESRPGMSGGGVFDKDGRLVGIHRASVDAQMNYRSIATSNIRGHLAAMGYELVEPPRPPKRKYRWLSVVGCLLLTAIFLTWIFWPPDGADPILFENSAEYFDSISTNACNLPLPQFSAFRASLTSPERTYLDMRSLAIAEVSSELNSQGSWQIVLVPGDCRYVARTKGELSLSVAPNLLPHNVHPSSYSPNQGKYRVADVTLTVTNVIWRLGKQHGQVFADAETFNLQGTLECPNE